MPDEMAFSLWLYALIIAVTILYGWLRWRWNLWLRDGVLHLPATSHALCLGRLFAGQGKAPDNNLLQEAYEKFCHSNKPFCGLGFYRWRQPVVLNFDYRLERLVLKRDFDYYADGGGVRQTLDDYWLRRHFYLPIGGWGELRGKLTPAFGKGDFTTLLPHLWQLAEHELIQALDAELAKRKDGVLTLLELQDICARYIVDVTAKCVFNLQSQALNTFGAEDDDDDIDREYQQLYAQLLVILQKHKAMDNLWQQWLPISWLDMWHKHQLQMSTFTFCNQILPQIAQDNSVRHSDLFKLLLALNTSHSSKLTASKDTIRTSTNMLLIFAGALARSLANMTLTLYELARHQGTQTELRQEILANDEKRYQFGALREREFLEHVINETQRSYCTVPRCLLSECSQDYATDYPGYKLHKGTVLIVPLQANCYVNVLYPYPSEWDASRFAVVELLDSVNQLVRKYCGQHEETDLDELQTSVGVMSLLKHFQFTLSKDADTKLKFDDSLPMLLLQHAPNIQVTRL